MRYDVIVGQSEAKGRLAAMVRDQRIPHALMFAGREGSGHLTAALVFAQHLFCQAPAGDNPCDRCPSCQKINKLAHPDLHLVFPIIKSKEVTSSDVLVAEFREAFLDNPYLTMEQWVTRMDAGNKQPVIPVEEANAILRKLSYTSYEGSYKVMVIWQPEKMNADSANRLLKILEEPPEKTIFILVSSQPDQLLATIISRVQQLHFYPCGDEEISAALQKRFGVNEASAKQAAVLAEGNYAEAVAALSQNDEAVSILQRFIVFMRLALKFDCAQALQWVEENAAEGREKQKQFLQYALQIFRDSLMMTYGDRSLLRLAGEERQFLEKFSPFVTSNNYQKLVEEYNNAYYYIERNANPKILFLDLLFTTARAFAHR